MLAEGAAFPIDPVFEPERPGVIREPMQARPPA
jgi:hypothetical protein